MYLIPMMLWCVGMLWNKYNDYRKLSIYNLSVVVLIWNYRLITAAIFSIKIKGSSDNFCIYSEVSFLSGVTVYSLKPGPGNFASLLHTLYRLIISTLRYFAIPPSLSPQDMRNIIFSALAMNDLLLDERTLFSNLDYHAQWISYRT